MTCVAHLLRKCAMKTKSQFEDVHQLIAKIKAVTIKNKTKQAKFSAIGYPPQPVPTRWGSWLNAALYYAKNCVSESNCGKFCRFWDFSNSS